jgi:hypothetical protein
MMIETDEHIFCSCFGCERERLVGDKVHGLTYSFEKMETLHVVAPIYAKGLGTWSDVFFSKLKNNKDHQIPWG